uniref:Venom protein n=1 Tax=Hadrurus spadix TaxID=141984 RepID=A0A1W7R943_9SCOR
MKLFILVCFMLVLVTLSLAEQTPCQEKREKILSQNLDVEVIPECEENGSYKDKQCKKNGVDCQCWRTDGTPINDFSPNLKACSCIRSKDNANRPHLIGNYKPQCEADGTYRLTQCWGSVGSCWCVDAEGRKLPNKHFPVDC